MVLTKQFYFQTELRGIKTKNLKYMAKIIRQYYFINNLDCDLLRYIKFDYRVCFKKGS